MRIQLVDLLTEADRALVHRAVDGFVPRKIFDAHAHLFHTRHFAQGNRPAFLPQDTAFGFKAYHEALDRWLPGR
ncbi:MAG: Class aminotransferase [Verrucomicrobiaceae bacterium]|nr:Class aminotransferase [Verrucomicrobiaceae bacterium]